MKTIVLLSCVSQKQHQPAPAAALYISPWFRKALAYARTLRADGIYILSAQYGLLPLEQNVAPYDLTLNNMKSGAVRAWAGQVLAQLRVVADLHEDRFVFLAGKRYRQFLVPALTRVEIPMEGLGIGKQLRFLMEAVRDDG